MTVGRGQDASADGRSVAAPAKGQPLGAPLDGRVVDALLAGLAGGALASTLARPSVSIAVTLMLVCGAAFALFPARAPRRGPVRGAVTSEAADRRARWLLVATLAYFVPVLTRSAPPGADITMHAAMGRAIALGEARLSPAYGDYVAAAYPRGLSVLIAVFASLFHGAGGSGVLGATWLVTAGAYAAWTFALRAFARDVLRSRHPEIVAVVASFASRQVQDFFSWGGSPNALALVFGLTAAAAASRAARAAATNTTSEDASAHATSHVATSAPVSAVTMLALREAAFATLMLAASVCVHPMGSVAAAMLFGSVCLVEVARADAGRRLEVARALSPGALLAGGAVVALTLYFKVRGPIVSPAEALWIHAFGARNANVVHGPWWAFPATYFVALTKGCGGVWLAVSLASAAFIAARAPAERRALAWMAALLFALGALVAWGHLLPGIGLLFYGARLLPLVSLVLTIPFARAVDLSLANDDARRRRVRAVVAIALAVAGVAVHLHAYQRATPVTTRDDVALMACIERVVPADAVIEGLYGDGTLWIPALTGRQITYPHVHVTLFDEFHAEVGARTPTFRYVGAAWKYRVPGLRFPYPAPLPGGDEPPAEAPTRPNGKPLCEAGAAALYAR